jgi:serine phosphatase RsbU (regulator of sigma subunit)
MAMATNPELGVAGLGQMELELELGRVLTLPESDLRTFLSKNQFPAEHIIDHLVSRLKQKERELYEALQQRMAISEILRAISNSPNNSQSVLDTVAEAAARLCEVTNAEIFQVEEDGIRLVAKYGDYRIWPKGYLLHMSRGLVLGRTILDRTSIHVHDLQAAAKDFPEGAALANQYGHRTVFATPLLRAGIAIGAVLIRRMELRPLTDSQIALMKTFADQAAIAIENVRLFNETKESLERQTATSEILKVISRSPTGVQPVFDAIVQSCGRLFGGLTVGLNMVRGDVFDRVAFLAKSPEMRDETAAMFPMPLNEQSLAGRTMLRTEVVHVEDLRAETSLDERMQFIFQRLGARSALCVPIMREAKAIGSIIVFRDVPGRFKDEQVALLQTFADQAGIAIENVRLFNQIQEKSRKVEEQAKELTEWNTQLETRVAEQVAQLERFSKLEHELALAREIQNSMLPRSVPQLEGYEFSARMIPAKYVGGDFFDFIQLGGGLLAIAIGDVSDKGVPAALFMAMVRSLLRAETHPGRSLQRVLRSVNRHLIDMNDKEMFVTILFGVLDSSTHQFKYVRAGHEAPIFFDPQGSFKHLAKTKGQALGVFEEVDLDEQTIELPRGSMLLLCSDGIPEAPNRQNISLGYDGVVRTVGRLPRASAQAICDELIRAAVRHQAGSPQHDDMTIVMLRAV